MVELVKLLLSAVAELVQANIEANAEGERQALLKMQRAIVDAIAERELI